MEDATREKVRTRTMNKCISHSQLQSTKYKQLDSIYLIFFKPSIPPLIYMHQHNVSISLQNFKSEDYSRTAHVSSLLYNIVIPVCLQKHFLINNT